MDVRIKELVKECTRKSVTGFVCYETFYIAQVKKHWWTPWKYVCNDSINEKGEHTIRVFDDADEVKNYIREKYLDKLCKLK